MSVTWWERARHMRRLWRLPNLLEDNSRRLSAQIEQVSDGLRSSLHLIVGRQAEESISRVVAETTAATLRGLVPQLGFLEHQIHQVDVKLRALSQTGLTRRLMLVGASGGMNYGDELIAIRTAQYWQAQGCEVMVCGFDASTLTSMLRMHGVNAPAIASLWATAGGYATMRQAFEAGLSFTPDAAPDREAAQLLAFTLTQMDAIHFTGGGYINSTWPRAAFLLGLALAEKARRPFLVFVTGVGLIPLSADDADQLAEIAEACDIFEARDRPSADALTALGARRVITGCDDSFLGRAGEFRSGPGRVLHLNAQLGQMPLEQKPVVIEVLGRILDAVGDAFDEIQVWPLCPSVDKALYEAIPVRWRPKTRMIPFMELMEGGFRAAPGDGAVVSRFHAHLLLARLGVSGLFIDGQNCEADPAYYRTKHASLQLAGSGWTSCTQIDPRDALAVFAKGCSAGFDSRNRRAKAELYGRMLRQIAELPRHEGAGAD